jgi:phosphatidylglycerol:prolipoprotein diacylglycerol transferase
MCANRSRSSLDSTFMTMSPRGYYSLFMVLALVVFVTARAVQPKSVAIQVLPGWKRWFLALAAFIGGTLGAKLPFALSSDAGWWTEAAWISNGKTITTGLIGAYLAVEVAKLGLGIRVKTGDSFAVPLALALAVGRLGCFFNGCCYGQETGLPWGVDFGDGLHRHPTQIYESLFHLSMAVILWQLIRRGALRYQRLKFYLICYGVYRFLTEFIRPEPVVALGLTYYQWVALALILPLCVQWAVDARLAEREDAAHSKALANEE